MIMERKINGFIGFGENRRTGNTVQYKQMIKSSEK